MLVDSLYIKKEATVLYKRLDTSLWMRYNKLKRDSKLVSTI